VPLSLRLFGYNPRCSFFTVSCSSRKATHAYDPRLQIGYNSQVLWDFPGFILKNRPLHGLPGGASRRCKHRQKPQPVATHPRRMGRFSLPCILVAHSMCLVELACVVCYNQLASSVLAAIFDRSLIRKITWPAPYRGGGILSKQDQRRGCKLWATSSCPSGAEYATRSEKKFDVELN
jgi:hypothetical protein